MPIPAPSPRPSSPLFLSALVLVAVFLAYAPCLHNGFVNWDDERHLLVNPSVRSLDGPHLARIWTSTINETYIPLTIFSYALEYRLNGYDPFVYHLDNLLLHLLATALVIALARRLGLSPAAAAWAGLMFGIHPLHVESVAWVTERKDVLFTVFYLWSLNVYLKYLDVRRRGFFWLSVLLGLCSVFAKPTALSLPLVMGLCDWYKNRKFDRTAVREKFFVVACLAPVAWVTFSLSHQVMEPQGLSGILIWIWSFWFYLWKFLMPGKMALFYVHHFPISLGEWPFMLSTAAFVLFWIALYMFRRHRLLVFTALFYVFTIFFLLRFKTSLGFVADRYMYLSSVGVCLLFGVAVERLLSGFRAGFGFYVARLALAFLFLLFAARTSEQCGVWFSGTTLWRNQLDYSKRLIPAVVYSKLADAYLWQDDFQDALRRVRARRNNPDGRKAYPGGAAQLRADERAVRRVLEYLDYATAIKPQYVPAYLLKADILNAIGLRNEALQCYDRVLRIEPGNVVALAGIARTGAFK